MWGLRLEGLGVWDGWGIGVGLDNVYGIGMYTDICMYIYIEGERERQREHKYCVYVYVPLCK